MTRYQYKQAPEHAGKFEVIGKLTHTCDGLEAHFPFEIFIKVYEASKQMPEILKLEALPLSRLWPKMFKMKPPDGQDIGLCFISSLQRSNGNFDHLLENTSSHIGLRAYVGTLELLIFSSKLLTQDYQTVPPGFTRLLALKKELGFCSVYKATERITPIGKADEIKIKQEDTTCKKTCGDTRIAGNLSPYECKQTPKPHECFTESLTNLWVDLFGVRIPTQVNVKTSTVGDLIEVALEKKGPGKSLKSYDVYVTYCGYIVKEDQLLSSLLIYKDSTFLVHHRVRGGMALEQIYCQPFVDYVNLSNRFHSVFLPKRLRPPGTRPIEVVFLSQHGRCSLHAILVCLAAIHRRGQSLNGNFDIQDIMFSDTIAVIRSSVTHVTIDKENFKKDYAKLADIIETWFATKDQHPVLYVDHLLELLRDFPSDRIYSECFRCYINNHCCVMSFLERLNLYQALDTYYDFQKPHVQKTFAEAVGRFDGWPCFIQSIEPIYHCYMYDPIIDEFGEKYSRYNDTALDWQQVCRNFINHARNQLETLGCFSLEQAEAALAWYFLNNLPELLLNIITNYKPPEGFDIRILFGNEKSDLAARS